ncbi:MAG: AAA family ATPase, partial [Pyrinomonadaceae bacterium]
MFKLQRLEITGFKSFADYTELVFTGDGITAVVGPNGCGKSNVADAIAWVLGEQRVKQLRGAEMKDVIFQGSRNRPPSGMAEVVLHMVRDETVEHEPDIDDIDSTLEEIDQHSIEIEEKLAPETEEIAVEGEAQSAPLLVASEQTEAASTVDASAGQAVEEPNAEQQPGANESQAEGVAADAANALAVQTKAHHAKRHWRPSRLALEFAPGEAVSVTRRLYRSGESEYLLNGRLCRLRDIHDLFSGTGLSGAHYAIIEQGRIGQILSAKPMDRRTIIEEAAGISKFRVRQRAAEARLESARSNLSRVSDIISEIERQVGSLRRQASKARRYRILREELRELLRRVYVAEERTLSSLLEETRTQLDESGREERALVEELQKREEDARNATQEARTLEDALSDARALAAESELQRDRRVREKVYQEEQAASLEKRRAEIESEIETLAARIVNVEAEVTRLRELDASLREASEESALVLSTAESAYGQRVSEVIEAEALIESVRAELLTHTAVAERLMEIGRQLESALERLALQAEGLAREGERAQSIHGERTAEAESLGLEIARAREHLAQLIAEREAAVHSVVQSHEAVADADAEQGRVREEFSRVRHRLDTLKELDEQRAHYSQAVQRLFQTDDAPEDFHFMGTLADMLDVEPQWERAVEGVLGSSLQSVIVPTPDDAARAAQWLRAHDAGRASFLVVGLHGASEETEAATGLELKNDSPDEHEAFARRNVDAASSQDIHQHASHLEENSDGLRIGDLLGAPPEILAVLNRTLPQRMNARIINDLEHAMLSSLSTGEMYVTRDGDWVSGGQLITAGDERALEEGAGLLAFKRELRELESRAVELEAEMATVERAVSEARARLAELEDGVVLLNEVIGREERDAVARELTAAQLAQEIERAERHMRVVADDAARLSQEQLEVTERRSAALAEAEVAEAARLAALQSVADVT